MKKGLNKGANHEEMQYTALRIAPGGDADIGKDVGAVLDASAEATVTAWVRVKGFCNRAVIVSRKDTFSLELHEDRLFCTIGNSGAFSSRSAKLQIDTWYHVAVSIWKDSFTLFIDGTTNINSGIMPFTPGVDESVVLGGRADMDLMRVAFFNRGLSADEVRADMFSDVKGCCCNIDFSQNPPVDLVTPSRTITLSNGAVPTAYCRALKLADRAHALPAQGTRRINPGGSGIDPYTVFTRFWIDGGEYAQALFTNCNFEDDVGMALFLRYDAATGSYRVHSLRGSYGDENHELTSRKTISAGRWTTVATVYDGNKLSIYIDGTLDEAKVFPPITGRTSQGVPVVGGIFQYGQPTGRNVLQGYIARMVVLDRAAPADEIVGFHKGMWEEIPAGAVLALNFSEEEVQNQVDGLPLSLCDGAITQEWSAAAGRSASTFFTKVEYDPDSLAAAERVRCRPDERNHLKKAFRATELGLRSMTDPASERYFFLTEFRDEGLTRIFVHTDRGSYEAYCRPENEIDAYTLWKIKLVFTLVSGVIYLLFGLKTILSEAAVGRLHDIIHASRVIVKFSQTRKMTLALLCDILDTLNKENLLFQLGWVLLRDIGLRQCLRALGKLGLKIGTGSIMVDLSLSFMSLFYDLVHVFDERPSEYPDIAPLALSAIRFNTIPGNSNPTSALTIRIDRDTPVQLPEWTSQVRNVHVSQQPVDPSRHASPAAYRIGQINAHNIAIAVSVTCDPHRTVFIRGIGGAMLGNVPAFVGVNNAYTRVTLSNSALPPNTGVSRFIASWRWEYSYDNVTWTYLDTSSHVIYLLLNEARTLPYVSDGNTNLQSTDIPWVQVLDAACVVANNATTYQQAASALCRHINQQLHIRYEGARHRYFNNGRFDLTRLLAEKLSGATIQLECSEVSVLMCIYANALGCDLDWVYMIGPQGSRLNYTHILLIGDASWKLTGFFRYHMINFTGSGGVPGVNSLMYDACLQIDNTTDPWSAVAPTVPGLLPGYTNATQYSTLAAPPALPIPIPYGTMTSYRERILQNTLADRQTVLTIMPITI